jgi:hypothetical protein
LPTHCARQRETGKRREAEGVKAVLLDLQGDWKRTMMETLVASIRLCLTAPIPFGMAGVVLLLPAKLCPQGNLKPLAWTPTEIAKVTGEGARPQRAVAKPAFSGKPTVTLGSASNGKG